MFDDFLDFNLILISVACHFSYLYWVNFGYSTNLASSFRVLNEKRVIKVQNCLQLIAIITVNLIKTLSEFHANFGLRYIEFCTEIDVLNVQLGLPEYVQGGQRSVSVRKKVEYRRFLVSYKFFYVSASAFFYETPCILGMVFLKSFIG